MVSIGIVGAPNGSGLASGAINSADEVDRYNIVLRSGELYDFRANSTSSLDTTPSLNQPDGTLIVATNTSPCNLSSRIMHQAGSTANYSLDVAAFNNASADFGSGALDTIRSWNCAIVPARS
jgi:hypothetical protein